MDKVFIINGYWKDNNSPIVDYIVCEGAEMPDSLKEEGLTDDDIFMYEMPEDDLKWHVANPNSAQDFVITSYADYFTHEN